MGPARLSMISNVVVEPKLVSTGIGRSKSVKDRGGLAVQTPGAQGLMRDTVPLALSVPDVEVKFGSVNSPIWKLISPEGVK